MRHMRIFIAILLLSLLTCSRAILCNYMLSMKVASYLPKSWAKGILNLRSLVGCVQDLSFTSNFGGAKAKPEAVCLVYSVLSSQTVLENTTLPDRATRLELRGVPPSAVPLYAAASANGTFRCLDNTSSLPATSLNDNFCDCPDGSDEPGTAACAGRPGTCFYCSNDLSSAQLIYSSRVGDGICDCCDGSDEAGGARPNPCPNVCEAQGRAANEERNLRRKDVLAGLQAQEESMQRAEREVGGWKVELATLEENITKLEEVVKGARSERDERQSAVDAEKKAAEAAEEAARQAAAAAQAVDVADSSVQSATDENNGVSRLFFEDFEDPGAMSALGQMTSWNRAAGGSAMIVDDPKGQRGKVLAMSSCTWGGDAFSLGEFGFCGARVGSHTPCRLSFWARGAPWQGFSRSTKRTEEDLMDAHSWLAVPSAHQDGFSDRLVSTEVGDEWVRYEYEFPARDDFQMFGSDSVVFSNTKLHLMVQAHASTGYCSQTMFDSFEVSQARLEEPKAPDVAVPEKVDEPTSSQKPEVSEYAKWALEQDNKKEEAELDALDDDEAPPAQSDKEATSTQDGGAKSDEETEAQRALSAARTKLSEAEQDVSGAQRKKKDLEEKLKHDLGEGFRWFSLVGTCVEKQLQEYKYKICFFNDARQGHTSLGRFEGWEEPTEVSSSPTMKFTNGDHCHGGPARTLQVSLVCGSAPEILDLSEPSRCTYVATVRHSSVCTQDALKALDTASLSVRMPHDEL